MKAQPESNTLVPWDRVISYGLVCLRLPPDQFWALSYREFCILLPKAAAGMPTPIGRATLENLIKQYPDGVTDDR